MELRGTNAILTGASRGLGVHIARAMAAKGANLVLSARSQDDLERVRAEIAAAGVKAVAIPADVGDPAQIHELIKRAEEELGSIDILVNNAGLDTIGPFVDDDEDTIHRSVTINLVAPMLLTRAVLPGMLERGRGHVVNVSSLAGKSPIPYDVPYAATKAGLIQFTLALRIEYARSPVGFSAILPGFTDDGMFNRLSATGFRPPAFIGVGKAPKVGAAVVRAIEKDLAEVIVNPMPIRPALVLQEMAPGMTEVVYERMGMMKRARTALGVDD
jgi:short-subunit dehydrogenase